MPDEVDVSFEVGGEPGANLAAWRAQAPPFLEGFRRVDDSYESLVYEADVTTTFMRITTFGFGRTLYRLTFTFRPTDDGTRVGVLGQAPEATVSAMAAWAATETP